MSNTSHGRSCWRPIPRSRRLVMDVLYWHQKTPTTAHSRVCNLNVLAAARDQSPDQISWALLFLKAYAIVAQKFVPLRQAFVRWPWPHLIESPHSVGMIVTHRDFAGEPWLFWSGFPHPESTSLANLQKQLDWYQTGPVVDVFKRQWLMSALPTPFRRFFQWWTLQVGGSKRAKRSGTFVLTTIGSRGAEIEHPPAFLTGNLTFGPFDENGRCRVTLAYDHRLLDGRMVADILAELEHTLNNEIANELTTVSGSINADSSKPPIRPIAASAQAVAPPTLAVPRQRPGALCGQNAIVTGASSGIGLEIARKLAAEGVNLVIAARSREPLERAASELRQSGVTVLAVPTDVADTSQLQHLVATTRRELGSIDILVNNAGIEEYQHFHLTGLDEIEQTINVNLTGAIKLTRLVVPHMLEQQRGHIINLSSTAGKLGPPFGAAYGASKAGLLSLSQSIRSEYAKSGLWATAICPGFTHDSGMYERMKEETHSSTPWLLGSTTTAKVADAVITSLKRKKREVILNFPPARLGFVYSEILPWFGDLLMKAAAFKFLRKVADARARTKSDQTRRAA